MKRVKCLRLKVIKLKLIQKKKTIKRQGTIILAQQQELATLSKKRPYPQGYAPYNQPQVVASAGNHQIISNNGGVFYNPPAPGFHTMYPVAPHCPICRRDTSSIIRQVPGGVTWIWCFVLFVLTGVCCCIPFCVDSCQGTEVVCATCQCVKARIDANCC